MSVELQTMINFHLTGKRGSDSIADLPAANSCPALLAPYRELSKLRYDFPMILIDDAKSLVFADSLTGVINRLLRDIAPEGNAGELLRQHVLRLEARMRQLAADSLDVSLVELWRRADRSLLSEADETEAELLGNSFATARFALNIDGQIANCDDRLPARLLQHAWAKNEARRTKVSLKTIESLIIQLRNILKVDDLKNGGARTPKKLKNTLGRRYKDAFDFDLMSELLEDATLTNKLPAKRRKRIRLALTTLETQRFFVTQGRREYRFMFDSLSAALKSYNERLPEIANVIKAISIAELECENAYREETHSVYFERFAKEALTSEDLAQFPSYLVCLHESECSVRDMAALMEVASGDLPVKVLLQVSDAINHQMAQTFVAPGNAYVLQSAASNLHQQEVQVRKGLEFAGPAIFSIFAPFADPESKLPAYLVAAAAMESRVFPAFSYDPAGGHGLVDRFDIHGNPNVEEDWPSRELRYEDAELQTVVEDYIFTLADFALTDAQFNEHFAVAAKDDWNENMLSVAEYLELDSAHALEKVPFVPVVDGENVLRRFVVDEKLIRMVRRSCERWHTLQEHGGVHNSYVSAALQNVEVQPIQAEAPPTEAVETIAAEPAVEQAGAAAEPDVVVATSDEPYIDTPRCTTCDECTNRNDRMFAYDDNKQAYIKDPDAGTYKQLVEAAEECQVAIIHPGKPRNPGEPGLDELITRAEPFQA